MNVTTLRAFSTTASKNALKWAGATKQDIINLNPGKDGAQVVKALEDAEAEAEEKYGDKADYMKIQGAKLHKSTKDANEKGEVVTFSVHTKGDTRLESGHAREDGTSKTRSTRAGGK